MSGTVPDFTLVLQGINDQTLYYEFANSEIPEQIDIGGEQMLAVHQLLGGGRVVDALGQQPSALRWSGWILGEFAAQKQEYLAKLRKSGAVLTFSTQRLGQNAADAGFGLSYTVIIRSFTAVLQRFYHWRYTITLEVVTDLNAAPAFLPDVSIDSQMAADLQTASSLTTTLAASPALTTAQQGTLAASLSALQQAQAKISSFANATTATLNSVLGPIKSFRTAVQGLIAQADNTLQNVATVGGLIPNSPVAANAARLTNTLNTMNSSPQLVQLDGVLARMGNNVAATPTAGTKTVTVSGGSLYTVAQQQYGDATQWTVIASANGLTDPQISGTVTLMIPPAPTSNSGGVLNG